MEMLLKLATVFGLAALELWAAIPAGLALQLDPVLVGMSAAAGGITGAGAVALLGQGVRDRVLRWHGRGREGGASGRLNRIWLRFGVAGLGLLAPLLVGAPLGTALGLTLGAPAGRLFLWMSLGIVIWSGLLAAASALGLAGLQWFGH